MSSPAIDGSEGSCRTDCRQTPIEAIHLRRLLTRLDRMFCAVIGGLMLLDDWTTETSATPASRASCSREAASFHDVLLIVALMPGRVQFDKRGTVMQMVIFDEASRMCISA
jgi:hypothetical protein